MNQKSFSIRFQKHELSFTTEISQKQSAEKIRMTTIEILENFLEQIQKTTHFDSPSCLFSTTSNLSLIERQVSTERERFSLKKQQRSHLSFCPGLYCIVNSRFKKIYLGGTMNLAQRKGEHRQGIFSQNSSKLLQSFQLDLQNGEASDFLFLPIVILEKSTKENFSSSSQFQSYIENQLEKPVLDYFLNSQKFHSFFYNKKITGRFEKNQSFERSPKSGSPSQPLRYKNYAWESISAVSKSLKKDRKSIRNRRESGFFSTLSQSEFESFSGIKITNKNAESFFEKKENERFNLLTELRFRSKLC